MDNLTAKERKALRALCNAIEQELMGVATIEGAWPELEEALNILEPIARTTLRRPY